LFRGSLYYVTTWKRWLVWDSVTWRVEDTIQPQVREACDELHVEISQIQNPKTKKAGKAFALQSENIQRRRAAEALAATDQGVRITHDVLDQDPWLAGVENGVLDLRTGEVRKPEATDWITKRMPVAYDPQAQAPLWLKF